MKKRLVSAAVTVALFIGLIAVLSINTRMEQKQIYLIFYQGQE